MKASYSYVQALRNTQHDTHQQQQETKKTRIILLLRTHHLQSLDTITAIRMGTNPETHAPAEGDIRRVNSCFFSVKSCLSNDYDEDDDRSDVAYLNTDNDLVYEEITQLPSEINIRSNAANITDGQDVTNKMTVDSLYHEIMMNIFSYMSAHDLASFSSTGEFGMHIYNIPPLDDSNREINEKKVMQADNWRWKPYSRIIKC